MLLRASQNTRLAEARFRKTTNRCVEATQQVLLGGSVIVVGEKSGREDRMDVRSHNADLSSNI